MNPHHPRRAAHPLLAGLLAAGLLATAARGQETAAPDGMADMPGMQHHGMRGMAMTRPAPQCPDAAFTCASTATPFFAPDGSLHLAWTAGGRVLEARSTDFGQHFAARRAVNTEDEHLDSGPDSRPALVVDAAGRSIVAYAIFKDSAYNGQVKLARAAADGAFSTPEPISADPASQRFVAMALDADGSLFAAWIDKRNRVATGGRRPDYVGAGLAWSWTGADGGRFAEVRIAVDNTCECCRLGIAFAGPGRPVVLFRNIFPGSVRDHAVIAFSDPQTPGPVHRVSEDDWVLQACPHHGPALAIDAAGAWHAAWFTRGKARQGVFYAHSGDHDASFSAPMPVGDATQQSGRPNLLALHGAIFLAWKQFDGNVTTINLLVSHDGGAHFGPARVLASTADGSDHPLLVSDGKRAFLSWLTHDEGYRLLPIEEDAS